MAAPSTPILDTFDRANGALGANWAQLVVSYSMPLIVSNQMNWPQFPSAAWNASAFAADQEVYIQGQNPTTAGVQLMVRMNNINTSSLNGYGVNASSDPGSAVEAFSWTGGVASSLGFFTGIIQSGDSYRWLNITGNTLSLYAGSDGVSYALRKQWTTDGLYTGTGRIGVYNPNNGSASFIDNFGGGASVTTTPLVSDTPPIIYGRGAA
jgi:hypothetical protein